MRYYRIEDGRPREVRELEKGAPLVYDLEEWRRRLRGRNRKGLLVLSLIFAVLLVNLYSTAIITHYRNPIDPELYSFSPFLLLAFLSLLMLLPLVYGAAVMRLRTERHDPAGLYENGLLLVHNTLLPYDEVERVEVRRWWTFLHSKHARRVFPGVVVNAGWQVDRKLLGPEGMAELEARVAGWRGPEGPPKLVLYGKGVGR